MLYSSPHPGPLFPTVASARTNICLIDEGLGLGDGASSERQWEKARSSQVNPRRESDGSERNAFLPMFPVLELRSDSDTHFHPKEALRTRLGYLLSLLLGVPLKPSS